MDSFVTSGCECVGLSCEGVLVVTFWGGGGSWMERPCRAATLVPASLSEMRCQKLPKTPLRNNTNPGLECD
jgi:hypothetical protein